MFLLEWFLRGYLAMVWMIVLVCALVILIPAWVFLLPLGEEPHEKNLWGSGGIPLWKGPQR